MRLSRAVEKIFLLQLVVISAFLLGGWDDTHNFWGAYMTSKPVLTERPVSEGEPGYV